MESTVSRNENYAKITSSNGMSGTGTGGSIGSKKPGIIAVKKKV
jgi:hypothetical protein